MQLGSDQSGGGEREQVAQGKEGVNSLTHSPQPQSCLGKPDSEISFTQKLCRGREKRGSMGGWLQLGELSLLLDQFT